MMRRQHTEPVLGRSVSCSGVQAMEGSVWERRPSQVSPIENLQCGSPHSLPAGLDLVLRINEAREGRKTEGTPTFSTPVSDVSSLVGGDTIDIPLLDQSEHEKEEGEVITPLKKKKPRPPPLKLFLPDIVKDDPKTKDRTSSPPSTGSSSSLVKLVTEGKKKIAMSLPTSLRGKQPRNYKIEAFVAILFMCCIFIIAFAYIYYHQHILEHAYFQNLHLYDRERKIHFFSASKQQDVLEGYLGTRFPQNEHTYECLPKDVAPGVGVCLEWKNRARLSLQLLPHKDIQCYRLLWESLSKSTTLKDCFSMSDDKGYWYGGGEMGSAAWPLHHEQIKMAPFVTGDHKKHTWGKTLKRYFMNSKGVVVFIDYDSPLHISINEDENRNLCLQANYNEFPYFYHQYPFPILNYTVCTGSVKLLHHSFMDRSIWDGLRKEDLSVFHHLLKEPVWKFQTDSKENFTQKAAIDYINAITEFSHFEGHLLLDSHWESSMGDFSADESRFPNLTDLVDIMHRRSLKLALTVHPFISTSSKHYEEGVKEKLWVLERESDVPALIHYKHVTSAAVMDITNNRTIFWLQKQLQLLKKNYSVDAFYLDIGSAYNIPHYFQFQKALHNPDEFKELFVEAVMEVAKVIGVLGAIQRPPVPAFVSLSPLESTWTDLQSLVPNYLTLSLLGYNFIMPGAVGGDYSSIYLNGSSNGGSTVRSVEALPPQELYIRWLQVITFLPVMQYSHLPNEYKQVSSIIQDMADIRKEVVYEVLNRSASEAINSGVPIIQPLWMLDPNDHNCQKIGDEFLVGGELLVAPVTEAGAQEREVYLPKGVWKDGIDGSLRKGGRWLHNYRVKLDKVAYFRQMPKGTRP